jgi:hypothetical protein
MRFFIEECILRCWLEPSTPPANTTRSTRGIAADCRSGSRPQITIESPYPPRVSRNEGIPQPDSKPLEIRDVAGRQGEVVDEGDRGDLLAERVAGIGDSEPAPDLSSVGVESKNTLAESLDDARQPRVSRLA